MIETSVPFANQYERESHFVRHGAEFGAANAIEYETIADAFMYGALEPDARQCVRPNGIDTVRFNFVTHFQAIAHPRALRTFYVVKASVIANHGNELGYHHYECNRTNL